MSTTHTARAPRARVSGKSRGAALGWTAAIGVFVVALAALALALWPASEADKAREDGKQVGEAVGKLYYAQSASEADAALAELNTAVADTREHAGDAVANQAADQEDALARAVDGAVGSATTGDDFEYAVYQTELEYALNDLETQADDFRATGSDVQQAFWEGFQEGLPGD
jgi:hypothetical protein